MREEWKDVIGYEGVYRVSSLGRVESLARLVGHWQGGKRLIKGRILKRTLDDNGYAHVKLCRETKEVGFKVHQLVAMSFLGHKRCGYKIVVDHIDNNPLNNNLNNLQLISHRQNTSKDKVGTSKYTGVSWDKSRYKWTSRIKINGKIVCLGRFKEEYTASIAYQTALHNHLNK